MKISSQVFTHLDQSIQREALNTPADAVNRQVILKKENNQEKGEKAFHISVP